MGLLPTEIQRMAISSMAEVFSFCDAETVMEMAGTGIIGLESGPLFQALIPIMVITKAYGKILR